MCLCSADLLWLVPLTLLECQSDAQQMAPFAGLCLLSSCLSPLRKRPMSMGNLKTFWERKRGFLSFLSSSGTREKSRYCSEGQALSGLWVSLAIDAREFV